MSRFTKASENIPVTLPGGCQCDGSPHEEDVVYLSPRLSFEGGVAAAAAVRSAAREGGDMVESVERHLGTVLVIHGVVDWNLLDDRGDPVPITEQAIRSLDWQTTLFALVDKATALYGDEVLLPFLPRPPGSSPTGRTAGSTSPPSPIQLRSRRSRPSSRGTTAASAK